MICEGLRAFDWGISATVGVEIKQCFINFGYDVSLGKEHKEDRSRRITILWLLPQDISLNWVNRNPSSIASLLADRLNIDFIYICIGIICLTVVYICHIFAI